MERKITIEEDKIYREDYQMRMLQSNRIEGLLDIRGRGVDGKSCYDYDVSGKVSVKALYEKNEIGAEDIRNFLKRLLTVADETEKYLLDIHRLLLEPEYIYYEDGKYYFCYYPPGTGSLWTNFHTLTEYFVKRANYKDQTCVQMVFLLHKETMEENYSLERLAAKCLGQTGQEEQTEQKKKEAGNLAGMIQEYKDMEEYESVDYIREKDDWITGREMGSAVMEEADHMWSPVRRFLNRRKKPKWGDWDGLYIEEEEL